MWIEVEMDLLERIAIGIVSKDRPWSEARDTITIMMRRLAGSKIQ